MCLGPDCHISFDDAVFEGCSLLVLGGAQATLTRPMFRDMVSRKGAFLRTVQIPRL